MAIKIPKEANRLKGYTVATGVTIVGGMVVTKDSADTTGATVKLADGTTANYPLGLALETNVAYSDSSRYYDDYAKGGKVGSTWGPAIVEVYDDGRGSPFDNSQTYTINCAIYCGADGRLTVAGGASGLLQIGWCDRVPSSNDKLRVRLII